MINNHKNPIRKKNPARFVKDQEQELWRMKAALESPIISGQAQAKDPEFVRGMYFAVCDLLGAMPDAEFHSGNKKS